MGGTSLFFGGVVVFFRQMLSDIKQGIIKRWYLYAVVFVIAVITAEVFYMRFGKLFTDGKIRDFPGIYDCILYYFRGIKEYKPEYREAFDVPAEFFVWNFLTAYIVGDYPVRDLSKTGAVRIVRAKRRDFWWYSKCVFNVLAVVMVYVFVYAGVLVVSLINGAQFKGPTAELFKRIFMTELTVSNGIIVRVVITTLLSTVAVSMFQMLMAFVAGNVAGYASVVVVCVISAYYMKWFLPGNGMMVYRYNVVNQQGITPVLPLAWYVLMTVLCIVAGRYVFERKDIM